MVRCDFMATEMVWRAGTGILEGRGDCTVRTKFTIDEDSASRTCDQVSIFVHEQEAPKDDCPDSGNGSFIQGIEMVGESFQRPLS